MNEDAFALDPRLAADTVELGDLPLCRALVMDEARYPWVILVPRRAGAREVFELDAADRRALIEESCAVARAMHRVFAATKMNVAALGNVVAQLHVHHVARAAGDEAWPGPVWGAHPTRRCEPEMLRDRCARLAGAFGAIDGFVPAAAVGL